MPEEVVQPQDGNAEAEATAQKPSEEAKVEEKVEEKPVEEQPKRQVYSMPVAKAQEEKKRAVEKVRREAEEASKAEIERVRSEYEAKLRKATPNDYDSRIDEVAQKHGLDAVAARELADAIRGSIKLPDTSRYDQILQEREVEQHKSQVSKDFDVKVLPLILKESPQATPEHIREVKAKLEELAFTEGYNTYRLEDIYKVKREDFVFQNAKGAESPKGHGSELAAFKKLSDEEEVKLFKTDFETYKKYLDWQRGQESRYMD